MKKKHLKSNSSNIEAGDRTKSLCSLMVENKHIVDDEGDVTCKNCIDLSSRNISHPRGKIMHLNVRDGKYSNVTTGCKLFVDSSRATKNYGSVNCKSCLDSVDRKTGAWGKAKRDNSIHPSDGSY